MVAPEHESLVIFLHGVGSGGASMTPIAARWQPFLPASHFEAPDGPYVFDIGVGYQWYSLAAVTATNRPQRVAAARSDFDRVIGGIIAEYGFAGRLAKVALVGFSQGATMALDVAASGRWPVAAVVSFSGRFASPLPHTPSPSTQVLIVHGTDDTAVPVGESDVATAALQAAGLHPQTIVYPGLGHEISAAGGQHACSFIAHAFDQPAGR